jgi:hypothetical protein
MPTVAGSPSGSLALDRLETFQLHDCEISLTKLVVINSDQPLYNLTFLL